MTSRALPTRALVLTAGLGTRLRPLTRTRAKPAVPVAGEALVCRIIRWLAGQGVRELVLNLHYRPETITGLVGDGRQWGVGVRYSWEPVILGRAGGPRKALPLLDADRFFIVNGDTLAGIDLAALAAAHAASRARVTMALVPHPAPERYGGVVLDASGGVRSFARSGGGTPAAHYVGVQLVEADVFAALPDDRPDDTVNRLYPEMLAVDPGAIRGWLSNAWCHDIGTPADYLATALAIARREGRGDDLPPGRNCRIASGARLTRTVVWDDVDVPSDAVLEECVIGDGVRVPSGARWRRLAVARADGAPAADEARLGDLVVRSLDGGGTEARDA